MTKTDSQLEKFYKRYGKDYSVSDSFSEESELEEIVNSTTNLKHDDIIDHIVQRLTHNDGERLILNNHEYNVLIPNRYDVDKMYLAAGEADVLLVTPRMSYAIEVKTTNTPKGKRKARHQLWKDDRYINANWYTDKIINFYAYRDPSSKYGYSIKTVDPKSFYHTE